MTGGVGGGGSRQSVMGYMQASVYFSNF
jgi:hypothetical protein